MEVVVMKHDKFLYFLIVTCLFALWAASGCEADSGPRNSVDYDEDGDKDDGLNDNTDDDVNDDDDNADTDDDDDIDDPTKDNDNDGLSNQYEEDNGTDPDNADTDGDGVSDLAEVVAETDPTDPESNPQKEGNFYFLVPYQGNPDPGDDALVFSTDIQMADLFILQDTTGSMGMAIFQLKRDLRTVIIPEVADIIPDVWFGVGRFDDYANGVYGDAQDVPFGLLQKMTDDPATAQAAVNQLSLHNGMDTSESHVPAMWAVATGGGLGSYLEEATHCEADEIGYPCFRQGAVPIVMLISDATMHNGPSNYDPYENLTPQPPTFAEAAQALIDIHARLIGIKVAPGGVSVRNHMEAMANQTGTVDQNGDPLVFNVNFTGAGLGSNIVDAIAKLAEQVPMDISAEGRDDESDSVDATVFIDHIEPSTQGGTPDPQDPEKICVDGLDVADLDDDGTADTFPAVKPGTPVCFDIYVAENTTVPPTSKPEVYTAYVDVIGDSNTVLDTREVYFLVPPSTPIE